MHHLVRACRARHQRRRAGKALTVHVRYRYTIPGTWGGRTAVSASKQGEIYEIAQWYPRMAVYDDLRGWDTQPSARARPM
ncbi:hypothetical protein [Xanthomonas arboricola]|uniref:Uncharacterized protein n=6 Tax=Xanthomonas arboricola TaxID=56448 RepID=A0AAP4NL74_9XANT|nr:hypothetical protein [Xanthomonas arboricola]GAE52497.1 peptidase [Xanthomonas arboricola pv. pruni str. MAFF 311562]GAE57744.1 hypothetical protein XPR_4379 [Xanthomonas arboricola pv. pruni MAFF 301420]GAE60886.1 hypothetical protein XPN_2792 [Xanthomonas arboricola pv. pruni MAFF 301427]AKU50528.1 hypothetical protein AKJ12_12625 [Xanthomonas arboricola pv. juglandis]KCX00252.1 hypothetical protein DK27_19295 [Xanthomonas arboricola pv. pruni]